MLQPDASDDGVDAADASDATDDVQTDTPPDGSGDATDAADAIDVPGDGSGDADAGRDPSVWGEPIVLPLAARRARCASAPTCPATVTRTAAAASYRKDFFYPYELYPDAGIDDPIHGGRVQVAGIAEGSGEVTGVWINNVAVADIDGTEALTWYHVYPPVAVDGAPLWVNFHTRDPGWDSRESFTVRVQSGEDVLLDTTLPVAVSPVAVRCVVPVEDYSALDIFLENTRAQGDSVTGLFLNGIDVTAAACAGGLALAPAANTRIRVPLCAPLARGDVWTLVADMASGAQAVATGRVTQPFFGIETWGQSSDCAFPGGDQESIA